MATKQRRRRFSDAERQEIVRAWQASGESAAAYSARNGLGKSNLWRWARMVDGPELADRRRTREPARSAFAAVRVVDPANTRGAEGVLACELEGRSGLVVRIYRGCDEVLLRAVVAAVGGGSPC